MQTFYFIFANENTGQVYNHRKLAARNLNQAQFAARAVAKDAGLKVQRFDQVDYQTSYAFAERK